MKTSEFLKYLRIKKGISCRELSRLSGISHTTINDVENGLCHPSVFTVMKICNGLNVDIFDFFSTTNYLKEEKINVGKGEILAVDDNRILVDFDNGIEEYRQLPDIIYVRGINNCYLVQRLKKVNYNGTKKCKWNN